MRRKQHFNGKDKLTLGRLIEEQTGYQLTTYLSQAFRRSSYSAESGGKSNEMFEFIGDHVLSYYTVKYIAQRCGAMNLEGDYSVRLRQDRFSALKQELLSNESFAGIIDSWEIADYLIVGKDDEKNEVHKQTKVKADLFEAVIGAIAVECGWDDTILEAVVSKTLHLDERIDELIKNQQQHQQFDIDSAVTVLKELAEKEQCSQPVYEIHGPDALGYDKDGNPIWCSTCTVINDATGIRRAVFSTSKKNAKKASAYLVLCEHFGAVNLYGITRQCAVWTYKDGKLMPDILKRK